MAPFKNLVFDLGNVIIDIDYLVTIEAFQKLSLVDFSQIVSYSTQNHLFDQFETGSLSASQFRDEVRKVLKEGTTDAQINLAWNSIMTDFPAEKFVLLKELKTRYKTFALSNINEIHVETINEIARAKFGVKDFGEFFNAAYYSNEIGFRKPDKEIYEFILQKENLKASETFFVDDKAENVEAAKQLGFHAYQLKDRSQLKALLTELKII